MSFDLTGKKALVTGASRGIGRGIAVAYAAAGADVALLARNADLLAEVAEEIEALGRRAVIATADVLDAEATRAATAQAIDALGGLDILVNNAGGNSFSIPVAQMRMSGWEKTLRLNLDSIVHITQESLPALGDGGGSIINISSVAGLRALAGPMPVHCIPTRAHPSHRLSEHGTHRRLADPQVPHPRPLDDLRARDDRELLPCRRGSQVVVVVRHEAHEGAVPLVPARELILRCVAQRR